MQNIVTHLHRFLCHSSRALGCCCIQTFFGFDDIALARYVTPPLTTIRQPMLDIGCHAAQMLLNLLQEKTVQNLVLAPTLVERGSTCAPLK